MGKVKFNVPQEDQQKWDPLSSSKLKKRGSSRLALAPGAGEAILRFSLRKSFTKNEIDVGYPGSYANEVFKIARSQEDGEAVFDVTTYLLDLDAKREVTTRLLLPLPNIILTILHYSLPFLLFLQFLTFLAILVVMQGDDYWLRGGVIRGVSLERGWISASSLLHRPSIRLLPILPEHVRLRSHLWYAWNLMALIYLPLAILHAIFVLDYKSDGETSEPKTEERKVSLKPVQGDVIPDLENLTKEVQIVTKPRASEASSATKSGGKGGDETTQIELDPTKRRTVQHRYKVQRPFQVSTLLLLVLAITQMTYSSYVIFRYLTYYAVEPAWRSLVTAWISSTMNEYYTNYQNATDSAAIELQTRLNNLDELHMVLCCCGSAGYRDWQNVTKDIPFDELRYLIYPPAKNSSTFIVPYSCCEWMEQSQVEICDHTSGSTKSIHPEGCAERLVHLIVYQWLKVHFWSLIFVNSLMIPQVLLYLGANQPLAMRDQLRSIGKNAWAQRDLATRVIRRKRREDKNETQPNFKQINYQDLSIEEET